MAREKGVVVEEIHMDEDTPEDLCLDLLARTAFGNRNYGRNILGPASNVEGFTREDLFAYRRERYCPENIVISFAGNIATAEALALAETYFGGMERTRFTDRKKEIVQSAGSMLRKKPIEQAHFALGFPTVAREDSLRPAVQVMNAILGGGMSSRLFKKVREELGLAYSVYSYCSHYTETGMLTVYAGVSPAKAKDAFGAVQGVIESFQRDGVTEEEFSRGREQVKSGSIFSQENTSSQMLLYGKEMLYNNAVYDFERRMAEIAALTRGDVMEAIEQNFDFSRAAVAAVGNLDEAL